MSRKLLAVDIWKAMEIVEEFLRSRGIRYDFRPLYTRYGLRLAEYRVGRFRRIRLIGYEWGVEAVVPRGLEELESLLSVYEFKPHFFKEDGWNYVLELQIYTRKLEMSGKAMATRFLIVLALLALANAFRLGVSISMVACLLAVLMLLPTGRGMRRFEEPTEWAIPALYPYYRMRVSDLKNRIKMERL